VRWLAVDPADPKSVWAGIEASGSGSALWRTSDGGATWKSVADSYPGGRVQATGAPIAFAPTQPKTIYVPSTNLHYRTGDGGRAGATSARRTRTPTCRGPSGIEDHLRRQPRRAQHVSSSTAARPGNRSASARQDQRSRSSSTRTSRLRSAPRRPSLTLQEHRQRRQLGKLQRSAARSI
jgi:hypothetical protein